MALPCVSWARTKCPPAGVSEARCLRVAGYAPQRVARAAGCACWTQPRGLFRNRVQGPRAREPAGTVAWCGCSGVYLTGDFWREKAVWLTPFLPSIVFADCPVDRNIKNIIERVCCQDKT